MTGSFFPCSEDVGNHLFPDIVGDQPAGSLHGIFGGVPRPTPRGVLDPSPYAYLEAVSLVLAEGRARAVANGVKLGRKPTLTHHQRGEAIKRVNAGKETLGEIARSYNVSRWTIRRLS